MKRYGVLLMAVLVGMGIGVDYCIASVNCGECEEPNDPTLVAGGAPPCIKVNPNPTKTCDSWSEVRILIEKKIKRGKWSRWTPLETKCTGNADPRSHPSITMKLRREREIKTTTVEEVFETRRCKYEDPCYPDYYMFETTPARRETNTETMIEYDYTTRTWTPWNFQNPDEWFAFWYQHCK